MNATPHADTWRNQFGAGYANAFCLETMDAPALSNLADWFNALSNEALTSEDIPATKEAQP